MSSKQSYNPLRCLQREKLENLAKKFLWGVTASNDLLEKIVAVHLAYKNLQAMK